MTIPKNGARRKSLPASEAKYPGGYVLAEPDLHALVDDTRAKQIDFMATRMQVVIDVTDRSVDGKLVDSDLQHLQQLIAESPRLDYQRLMRAILWAVTEGSQGIATARYTAAHLVELFFVFSYERYIGLKLYQMRLRRSRQAANQR